MTDGTETQAAAPVSYDVQNTKEVLDFLLSLVSVAKSAQADGKIDLNDLGLMIALVPKVGPAMDKIDQVPAELKDLQPVESGELIGHVMTNLAITDEKARKVVEAGLKAAVANFELIKAIKS